MAIKIGPTFSDELKAAGVSGLPFAWSVEGLGPLDRLTKAQQTAVFAVLEVHDPLKVRPDRKALLKARAMAATTVAQLKAVVADLV